MFMFIGFFLPEGKFGQMLPKRRLGKPIFGHSAGSTKLDGPITKLDTEYDRAKGPLYNGSAPRPPLVV